MKKLGNILFVLMTIATLFIGGSAFVATPNGGKDTLVPFILVLKDPATNKLYSTLVSGSGGYVPPNPSAPVVLVGDNQVLPVTQNYTTLNGSSSYSPTGASLTFSWTKVSGPAVTIENPNSSVTDVTGLAPGNEYIFRLTVTDANELVAHKDLSVYMSALAEDEYYVVDSALFNFTPVAQNIPGYTDVEGDPASEVVTSTSANGVSVSTVSSSPYWWRGDEAHGDSSSATVGMYQKSPADPFGYGIPKEALRTGFINAFSQFNGSIDNYNLKISGLDDNSLYQIQVFGSWYDSTNNMGNTYAHNIVGVVKGVGTRHIANTLFNTSRRLVFDTLQSANGEINISLASIDSTYSVGGGLEYSRSIISGMKVYKISKVQNSTGITYLYKTYYDTVLMLNDGEKTRPVIVYRPYKYNPTKEYSLIYYQAGDESKVTNDDWDAQFMTNFGLSFVAEHEEGKVYGLDKNGDTVSYVIIQPQMNLNENLSAGQIDNLITAFKAKNLYSLNDSLYIGGFSSGGASIMEYLFTYPQKLIGAWIQPSVGHVVSTNGNSQDVIDAGVHVWVTIRDDGGASNADTVLDNLPPSLVSYVHWPRSHSGFAQEYAPEKRELNPKYEQSIFDFYANPKSVPNIAYWCFRVSNASHVPEYFNNALGTSTYRNPSQEVITSSDATTGWSINSVSTSVWSWATVTEKLDYTNRFWVAPYAINHYAHESGWYNSKDASFGGDGADMQITGLEPNHQYEVWVFSNGPNGNTTTFSVDGMSVDYVNSNQYADQNWKKLVATSDASGNIGLGVYGKTTSDIGIITALIVKEL